MVVVRCLLTLCLFGLAATPVPYKESIELWRRATEASLKADDGWLTVAGLFWLNEGPNPVQIPVGGERAIGVFKLAGSAVTFQPAPGIRAMHNGKIAAAGSQVPMRYGAGPDLLTFQEKEEDLTLFVIKRGGRFAVRMRDKKSGMRRDFTGLNWFPVKDAYRVEAKWVAYDTPKTIGIPNVLNRVEQLQSPGFAEFQLNGRKYTLEPVVEGRELFYIFKDLTAGRETYPAGRFLYSDLPLNGKVILDFNKAYNPPCAFTPYATCPLPPKQNRLRTRIEAGELKYGQQH